MPEADQLPGHGRAEFKSISRMVAKIVCREGRILVGFTDVHGPPLAIGIKLYPAMIAVYAAVVSLGGNAGSDREARGDADRPGQSDEVGMKIRQSPVRTLQA